jgi:hypothetical protein
MNAKTLEAVRKHGQTLLALFPHAKEKNPVALCKKLRRIENKVSAILTQHCNGTADGETAGREVIRTTGKVRSLLGFTDYDKKHFFVNGDPRGYALKMSSNWAIDKRIHRDWGQYGILAPDLTTN